MRMPFVNNAFGGCGLFGPRGCRLSFPKSTTPAGKSKEGAAPQTLLSRPRFCEASSMLAGAQLHEYSSNPKMLLSLNIIVARLASLANSDAGRRPRSSARQRPLRSASPMLLAVLRGISSASDLLSCKGKPALKCSILVSLLTATVILLAPGVAYCCATEGDPDCPPGTTCNFSQNTCDPCGGPGQACCQNSCNTGLYCQLSGQYVNSNATANCDATVAAG